ncbi:MAG: LysR substrate-binding domain-containing protein [Pseudomonadota bacterium]
MRQLLKVAVSSTTAHGIIPRLAGELNRALPEIEVMFVASDSFTARDHVLARVVELALVGQHFEHDELECSPFLEGDRLVVIVPPHSAVADNRVITLAQLKEQRFIARRSGSGTRAIYEPVLAAAGASLKTLRVVREEANTADCIEAVAKGEGVSIVSLLAAREAIEQGQVKALDLAAVTMLRNLYVIRHARGILSAEGRRFVDFIEEWCARCHHSAGNLNEEHGILSPSGGEETPVIPLPY